MAPSATPTGGHQLTSAQRSTRNAGWAATAFLAAALCLGPAVFMRWWPDCLPGRYETAACGARQSDSYDDALRAAGALSIEVWLLLAGFALFGVGVALLGLASGRWWAAACGWLGGLLIACMGPAAWGPPAAFDFGGPVLGVLALLATPVLVVIAGGPLVFAAGRRLASGAFLIGACLTNVLVDMYTTAGIIGYVSWDTTPWSLTPMAAGLVLMAGSITWVARPLPAVESPTHPEALVSVE